MSKVRRFLRQRGFTLIEILVVIVIIGVLSIMGVSKYTEFTTQSRIRGCVSNQNSIDKTVGVWESQNVAIPNITVEATISLNTKGLLTAPIGGVAAAFITAVPLNSQLKAGSTVLFDYSKDMNVFTCPERANIVGSDISGAKAETEYTWISKAKANATAAPAAEPKLGGKSRGTWCNNYVDTGPDGLTAATVGAAVHRAVKKEN
jgi:prepilin-type N-terminal cleavage/methylation domain-containing protein